MHPQSNGKTGEKQTPPEKFRSGWLDALDGRLGLAREMRERYAAITDDLGGVESLSYAERSLAERALWLEYWLASQERELAAGGDFKPNQYSQLINSLQGLYAKLGLQRREKQAPHLHEWMAQREVAT